MNVNPFSGYGQAHRHLSYILKTKDKEIEYRWTHRNVPLLSWIYKKVNLHDKFAWIYHVKICHFRWKSPKLYSPSICSVETIHSWPTYCLQRKKMRKNTQETQASPILLLVASICSMSLNVSELSLMIPEMWLIQLKDHQHTMWLWVSHLPSLSSLLWSFK